MLVSWFLPSVAFPLWPCAVLLAIFVPVSIWHERNWRRAIARYARLRVDAGAPDPQWPTWDERVVLGAQPWLLVVAAGLLTSGVTFAVWAAVQWPRTPAGFDIALNWYDLPYLWAMIVAGAAAIVAIVAIAIDALHSPWATVAECVRHSMYTDAETRSRLLAFALAADPGLADTQVAATLGAGAETADELPAGEPPSLEWTAPAGEDEDATRD